MESLTVKWECLRRKEKVVRGAAEIVSGIVELMLYGRVVIFVSGGNQFGKAQVCGRRRDEDSAANIRELPPSWVCPKLMCF